jgi:WD40 repeat protein
MRVKHGLTLAMVMALAAPAWPQADALMGAALHEERVTGNLQKAIEGYRKVLTAKGLSRAQAAQAEYHIGICYEKLGNQEARKAFENVVRNYGDQKDVAAQARARLEAIASPGNSGGVRLHLLWDNAADVGGVASGDGRYFPFTDWSTCDVAIHDLVTSKDRKVSNLGGCLKAQVMSSVASRDGSRIAFGVLVPSENGGNAGGELRVIGMDGKGEKTLMSGGSPVYTPLSWSPDGKWVAAGSRDDSGGGVLVLISLETNEVRRLAVKDHYWPENASISPDGQWIAYSVGSGAGETALLVRPFAAGERSEEVVQTNAIMIGWTPEGDGILFSRLRGTSYDLYVQQVAGGKASGPAIQVQTTSNVGTMPAGVTTQGTLLFSTFNRAAETLVLEWQGEVRTPGSPLANLPATTGMGFLLGSGAAQFSDDGQRILTVTSPRTITIRDLKSGSERIITPLLKTWRCVRFAHESNALLILGDGNDGRGGVYRVEDTTGKAALLAELPADTRSFAPSRDGKSIYYGNATKTRARDVATGEDKALYEFQSNGNYDLRVSHDGNRLAIRGRYVVVVDLRTGQSREIYRVPEKSPVAIWAMDWTADDQQLHTIVRPTGLTDKMESWIFSPNGGDPRRLSIPRELHGLAFSPDGKYVLTTRVTQRFQLWSLENFLPAKK